jgi:NAD(P)-dependent dehydrogenase (short-subunit alcohol dehydrogenase family)
MPPSKRWRWRCAKFEEAVTANFDLTGRLALITGSSRGLGWAFAQALADAGSTIRKPVLETTDDNWQSVIDADLSACFRIAREALRLLVPQGKGRMPLHSLLRQ